jgi:predicted TIM-barrel fold metal-dependent hydrolase
MGLTMALDYLPIDVDNHYYEAIDSCTRHLDKRFRKRGVQIVNDGKHSLAVIGDKVNRFIPNPTFDPIIVPGCLDPMFRGQIPEGVDPRSLMKVEKIELRPEYRNRDARAAVVESQGLGSVWMFPTFACGVEQALRHDVDATMATLHAFNMWLDEDWGFARADGKIVAAPMISLADPGKATEEVQWLAGRGAKVVHVRPAPVPGELKPRSLGDRAHDPVWASLAEANIPVAFHLGDSGYLAIAAMWGGQDTFQPFGALPDPFDRIVVDDRPIHDTMASLVIHGVFDRHPKLRVASIENGSDWVHRLIKRMKKLANQFPWNFPNDPHDTVREHIWIAPYYEEDFQALADKIGAERILFGSDWPHGEGLESPLSFLDELKGFSDADVRKIMRGNALDLLGVKVPAAA